jgi:hypothetical protein
MTGTLLFPPATQAQFASLSAGANMYGNGYWGGLQPCPYPWGAADGAEDESDEVKKIDKMVDSVKEELAEARAKLRKIENDRDNAASSLKSSVIQPFYEKIIFHMDKHMNCLCDTGVAPAAATLIVPQPAPATQVVVNNNGTQEVTNPNCVVTRAPAPPGCNQTLPAPPAGGTTTPSTPTTPTSPTVPTTPTTEVPTTPTEPTTPKPNPRGKIRKVKDCVGKDCPKLSENDAETTEADRTIASVEADAEATEVGGGRAPAQAAASASAAAAAQAPAQAAGAPATGQATATATTVSNGQATASAGDALTASLNASWKNSASGGSFGGGATSRTVCYKPEGVYASEPWKAICMEGGEISDEVCTNSFFQKNRKGDSRDERDCRRALDVYQRKTSELEKAKDKVARLEDELDRYDRNRERAKLEAEECPTCTGGRRRATARTERSTAPLVIGGVAAAIAEWMGYRSNKSSNQWRARTGFEALPYQAGSYGLPFVAMGLQGYLNGGSNGAFGCSGAAYPYGPGGMTSPMFQWGSPYAQAGANNPFVNPYALMNLNANAGGGMYIPGVGPWGIAGNASPLLQAQLALGGGANLGFNNPAAALLGQGALNPYASLALNNPLLSGSLNANPYSLANQNPFGLTGLNMTNPLASMGGMTSPMQMQMMQLQMQQQLQAAQLQAEMARQSADNLNAQFTARMNLMQQFSSLNAQMAQLNSGMGLNGLGGLTGGLDFGLNRNFFGGLNSGINFGGSLNLGLNNNSWYTPGLGTTIVPGASVPSTNRGR